MRPGRIATVSAEDPTTALATNPPLPHPYLTFDGFQPYIKSMNTTQTTAAAIQTAARKGNGDFYATRSSTARFCTEALADAAADLIIPTKYASESVPTWRTLTRDEALERLCGWANWQRNREWGVAFERSRAAAMAEFPAAIESLGAVL